MFFFFGFLLLSLLKCDFNIFVVFDCFKILYVDFKFDNGELEEKSVYDIYRFYDFVVFVSFGGFSFYFWGWIRFCYRDRFGYYVFMVSGLFFVIIIN